MNKKTAKNYLCKLKHARNFRKLPMSVFAAYGEIVQKKHNFMMYSLSQHKEICTMIHYYTPTSGFPHQFSIIYIFIGLTVYTREAKKYIVLIYRKVPSFTTFY